MGESTTTEDAARTQPTDRWYVSRVTALRNMSVASKATILLLFAAAGAALLFMMRKPCMDAANAPWFARSGMVRLQFAGNSATADSLLKAWSTSCPGGLADPRNNLHLDWLFIAVYVIGLVLLTLCVMDWVRTSIPRLLGVAVALCVLFAGALDAIENIFLYHMLGGSFGAWVPPTTRVIASLKVGLLLFAIAYVVLSWLLGFVSRTMRHEGGAYDKSKKKRTSIQYEQVPVPGAQLPGGPESKAATLSEVLKAELAYIRHHRRKQGDDTEERTERSLVGLAFSGGGIRSATTNLGILQGLAELEILPFVDYLSTVSGGGYIGTCFSSLLSLTDRAVKDINPATNHEKGHLFAKGDRPAFSTRKEEFPLRDERTTPEGRRATDLLAHLRTHGNFLIARRGLLKRDTLRAIGNIISGVVYNVSGFALILVAAAALYLAILGVTVPRAESWLKPQSIQRTHVLPDSTLPKPYVASSSTTRSVRNECAPADTRCAEITASAIAQPGLGRWIARNLAIVGEPVMAMFESPVPNDQGRRGRIAFVIVAALLSGIAATIVAVFAGITPGLFPRGALPPPPRGESFEESFDKAHLWMLAILLMGWIVITTAALQFSAPYGEHMVLLWVPLAVLLGARVASIGVVLLATQFRGWDRHWRTLWGGYQAIIIYGLWLFAAFIVLGPLIYAFAGNRVTASVGGLVSLIIARLATPSRSSGESRRLRIPRGMLHFVLAIAVVCTVTFGLILAGSLIVTVDITKNNLWLTTALSVVTIMGLGLIVDHNKLGLHYFYRDRLAETYLFSEVADREHRLWTFRDAMEMPLSELHGNFAPDDGTDWQRCNPAPYHLISAAINLAGSRDLTRKDRKSGYFLFSKLYCGSTHTGFRPTAVYRDGETKLARAMAISGAAASSAIGFGTFFAQAFATVLFNVRLGYWLENPALHRSQTGNEGYIFWPEYLAREVTMNTSENTRLVNLSDGGHTGDNVGIYPLFQRGCRVIIACDAETDGALTFGSFTEALRHAYIDLGISVDIDLSMIRPDPVTGRSKSHCAVGRIKYPDRPNQVSYIVYMKNSLTGDEPEPVLNYHVTCPDFPHETTLDQFFDDAQFESYRALGVHIAKASFAEWSGSLAFVVPKWAHTPKELVTT